MFRFSAPLVALKSNDTRCIPIQYIVHRNIVHKPCVNQTFQCVALPGGPRWPGSPLIGLGQLQLGSTWRLSRELISSSNFWIKKEYIRRELESGNRCVFDLVFFPRRVWSCPSLLEVGVGGETTSNFVIVPQWTKNHDSYVLIITPSSPARMNRVEVNSQL